MKSSTGYFVDIRLEKGIGDDLVPIFFVLVFIKVEFLNVGQADGSFGFAVTSGVVVLIRLAGAVYIEFKEGGFFLDGLEGGCVFFHLNCSTI